MRVTTEVVRHTMHQKLEVLVIIFLVSLVVNVIRQRSLLGQLIRPRLTAESISFVVADDTVPGRHGCSIVSK